MTNQKRDLLNQIDDFMVFFITDGEGDALRRVAHDSSDHPIFLRAVLENEDTGKF